MLNPEYYSSSFTIINAENEEVASRRAKYHSSTQNIQVTIIIYQRKKKICFIYLYILFILQPGEEVVFGNALMERQIIACIPIPGLNEWAKDVANANQNVEVYVIIKYFLENY